jgi:hypothetical protein
MFGTNILNRKLMSKLNMEVHARCKTCDVRILTQKAPEDALNSPSHGYSWIGSWPGRRVRWNLRTLKPVTPPSSFQLSTTYKPVNRGGRWSNPGSVPKFSLVVSHRRCGGWKLLLTQLHGQNDSERHTEPRTNNRNAPIIFESCCQVMNIITASHHRSGSLQKAPTATYTPCSSRILERP